MSFTKFNHNGGPISIFPRMQGGMNCGYSISAFLVGSSTPFNTISGTIDNPLPLVFDDAGLVPEKTIVMGTFQFRAGNGALVNSPYTLGLIARQEGNDLKDESTEEGQLPELVTVTQVSLILISAVTVSNLNTGR